MSGGIAIGDHLEVYDPEGRAWRGWVIMCAPETVCIRFAVSDELDRDVWFRLNGKQHGIPDALALRFRRTETVE